MFYLLHQCRSTLVLKGTSIPLIIIIILLLTSTHVCTFQCNYVKQKAVIVPEHVYILHWRSWSVPLCLVCPKVAGTAESGRLTSKTITIIMASQLAIFVNYPSNRRLAFDCVPWCKFNVLVYLYIRVYLCAKLWVWVWRCGYHCCYRYLFVCLLLLLLFCLLGGK